MAKGMSKGGKTTNWSGVNPSNTQGSKKSAGTMGAPRAVTAGPGSGKTGMKVIAQGMTPARGIGSMFGKK